MKGVYFFLFCFFFLTHSLIGQKIESNENLFKEMWVSDSCGEKGYRQVLSSFIVLKYKHENVFKTKEDIMLWLGEPNKIYNHSENLEFCYIVKGNSNCSLDLEDSVLIILSIFIDKRDNVIMSISRSIF